MGFCHCDLWSGNLLMKGENLIAIDFETASTGILVIKIVTIIMVIKWGVGTRCVPTPKMAYFSVFKAFLFLKYFKNNLGLIESSFNP